jgi:hypothetical protein
MSLISREFAADGICGRHSSRKMYVVLFSKRRRCSSQQFADAVDGVVGDSRQHPAQITFGIEAIQLRLPIKAVQRGAFAGLRKPNAFRLV